MTRKDFLIDLKTRKISNKFIKPVRGQAKPYALMSMKEKYLYNDINKLGYLDIETTGLQADFDFTVSYAIRVRDIKTGDRELRGAFITEEDFKLARKAKDADVVDRRILYRLMEDIEDLDCLIGHWFIGKHRHDVPFIRTRLAINKVPGFPKHKMVRYGDTQKWGSQIHRLHSNGLASMADAFGIAQEKTQIKTKAWKNASLFGTPKDVAYIYKHNVIDVDITEAVHKCIEEYVPIPAIYC